MPFRPESLSTYRMNLWSLPGSTGALRSSSMATSSSHLSSVFAHGQHSNLTPSIVHSLNAGILSSDLISYPGVPAQATRCADPLGGVQNRNVRDSVQREQIPGSVRGPNEFDDSDEWLRCLVNENLDGIITTDVTGETADLLQMAGSAPVSSPLNSEKCQPMTHQSVPSSSRQLRPTISPPSTTNIHSPKRTKARMRWTVEMHDRFRDAVNQLGGSDNATPKAILGLMKVEGLTRDQVKSHLQKYKSAQVKHHTSEGTTMPTEVVPSCVVQIIEAFALRVQMEFQKKLHDMVDKTHHDLMEIHSRMFEKHVMNLHELEKRRKLSMDSMSHLSSPAAALASASATLPEDRSNSNAKLDADGHVSLTVELQRMPEAGSHGDAGA